MQTTYNVKPAIAIAGLIADARGYDAETGINEESSAAIPPGIFVYKVAASAQGVKLPSLAAHITGGLGGGFVIHQDTHLNPNSFTNTDRASFQPKEPLAFMREGYIWVQVEDAVTKGNAVYVRFTARLTNTQLGKCRSDADTASSTDYAAVLKDATYETSASAGGFAKVRLRARSA